METFYEVIVKAGCGDLAWYTSLTFPVSSIIGLKWGRGWDLECWQKTKRKDNETYVRNTELVGRGEGWGGVIGSDENKMGELWNNICLFEV